MDLGANIGYITLLMAELVGPNGRIYAIEPDPSNFELLKAGNIKPYVGSFDEKLPEILNEIDVLNFVYFDGNHKKEASLKYFNQCIEKINNNTIFVFDDIHWSRDMEEAWKEIKQNPKVKLTIDLFCYGLVFFKKELSKQDFIVKF